MKRLILFVTLLLVTVALIALPPAPKKAQDPTVTVYYFHRQVWCHTCRTAEATAFAALREHFPDQVKEDRLLLKSVTVDGTADEKALAKEFGAFGPSLFVEVRRGKEVKKISLDKMWETLRKGIPTYQAYVVDSVKAVLK